MIIIGNSKTYSHNNHHNIENINGTLAYLAQIENMQKELEEVKDKYKIVTNKFTACKKERDDLKNENKELQD